MRYNQAYDHNEVFALTQRKLEFVMLQFQKIAYHKLILQAFTRTTVLTKLEIRLAKPWIKWNKIILEARIELLSIKVGKEPFQLQNTTQYSRIEII